MNSQDFCFWLQGYFEVSGMNGSLSERQVEVIKNHLNLVFLHDIDPKKDKETTTPSYLLHETHNPNNPNTKIRC